MIGVRFSPWLSDSAVNFLSNVFDWWPCYATEYGLDSKTVLEFGSGSSTFWFLQQGFNVVTVETDRFYQDLLLQMSNLFDVSYTVGNSIPPFLTQKNKSESKSFNPSLHIISVASYSDVPSFIFSHPWILVLIDGAFRLDILKAFTRSPSETLICLDNPEFCSDWGILPISSGFPERARYYRELMRSENWRYLVFEQAQGSGGKTVSDAVGARFSTRHGTAFIWSRESVLGKCLLTTSGLPMITPDSSDDSDLSTLRERCPYPSNQSLFHGFELRRRDI